MATRKKTAQEIQEEKELVEERAPKGVEKVKIKLFRDNDRYTESVYVAVNGESYMVPRGVEVEVPVYIAEALQTSMDQDQATAEKIMGLETKWDREPMNNA